MTRPDVHSDGEEQGSEEPQTQGVLGTIWRKFPDWAKLTSLAAILGGTFFAIDKIVPPMLDREQNEANQATGLMDPKLIEMAGGIYEIRFPRILNNYEADALVNKIMHKYGIFSSELIEYQDKDGNWGSGFPVLPNRPHLILQSSQACRITLKSDDAIKVKATLVRENQHLDN